jgi:ornithine--oxo-acid transaminase
VIVPPDGYLRAVREICDRHNVLMIADEIQSGLGRAGKFFAYDWEGVKPDLVTIGKALSGGLMPVSAVLGTDAVMGLFDPGSHGSTFGGNPLGCAVAREAIRVIVEEDLPGRAHELGTYFRRELRAMDSPYVQEVRGKGLLIGVELKPEAGSARRFCRTLKERGILAKDTHGVVIRFAPPLVITRDEIDWAVAIIAEVLGG